MCYYYQSLSTTITITTTTTIEFKSATIIYNYNHINQKYGECTILEAELRAILDGITLAQRLGLSVLWVESDSTLAIHCITKGGGPWNIQATLRHIRHLLALDRDTITHIFREGNQVADLLASEGWDRRYYYEYSSQDLPRRHRSLVQIDRFGLPTIRGL
ncbi:Uncharacterized protein Adt_10951 [Abeliophyllum distichum]|uniref:RNase H type-1 domain-containing protein n=1 Tax=Abeliophyllum distichum TaxID=126358 RepID=A0ABD1ULG2_9LAMI